LVDNLLFIIWDIHHRAMQNDRTQCLMNTASQTQKREAEHHESQVGSLRSLTRQSPDTPSIGTSFSRFLYDLCLPVSSVKEQEKHIYAFFRQDMILTPSYASSKRSTLMSSPHRPCHGTLLDHIKPQQRDNYTQADIPFSEQADHTHTKA
jgi:hypothetical protein